MNEITEDEFKYFSECNDSEKILYFYDILLELENPNMFDEMFDDGDVMTIDLDTKKSFDSIRQFIEYTTQSDKDIMVHFIDDYIILNSNRLDLIETAIKSFFVGGNILISENDVTEFKTQKYCRVFTHIGNGYKLTIN